MTKPNTQKVVNTNHTLNKSKKKVTLYAFIACCFLLLAGMIFIGAHQTSKDFKETKNLNQSLNHLIQTGNNEQINLVFFKPGCPYCEAGKPVVQEVEKKASGPVFHVSTQSKDGQALVKKYAVQKASSIIVLKKDHVSNKYEPVLFRYAGQQDGKPVALKNNIEEALVGKVY